MSTDFRAALERWRDLADTDLLCPENPAEIDWGAVVVAIAVTRAALAQPEGQSSLNVNLTVDTSPENLKQLCDGLAAAVTPNGGYEAATTDDPDPGAGGDQMVQVQWWIPQHGCDSLENTLDAIKYRIGRAVMDWWATALVPAAQPAPAPEHAGRPINDEQRKAVRAAVAQALGDAYDCHRVWEAWDVGSMGSDDFELVAEDDDRVAEIADAAIQAICPAAPPPPQPAPNAPAEALAARPLLEQMARLSDCIGANTAGQIMALSSCAGAWLRDNPPGRPVVIEPRGCPMPGACSCVEPAPPVPEAEERPNKRDVNRWLLALPPHGTSIEELSGIVLKALAHWRDRPASLPAPKMGLPGLHGKYIVWKSADRSPVKYPCFVLRVDGRDDAAMAAIQAYAAHPDCPPELAADLAQAIRQNATVDLRRATSPPAPL